MKEVNCPTCSSNIKPWSFSRFCEKHDVCVSCGIKRKDLTDTPWGVHIGAFLCKPCELSQRNAEIAIRQEKGFDHEYSDNMICPYCGHEFSDIWEMTDGEYNCPDCEKNFEVETNHSVTYTTSKKE